MDKAIELLKKYSDKEMLKIVVSHAIEKVDYGSEWEDDLFYKGIQFASKHGTDFYVITFVDDKLYEDTPKSVHFEDTIDYVFTQKNLSKMIEYLEENLEE